jgi:OOP family OmpA-OmpF porin
MMKRSLLIALASVALFFIAHQAPAQTIGYAEAIDRLAVACKADIAKFCKTEPLGGGRVQRCLDQATVSPGCRAASAEVKNLLQRRAEARAAVPRACDVDSRRLCAGIQSGDGNLLECFHRTRARASAQCQKAITDAGYD